MEKHQSSMGRMELAQSYFPFIQPRSAWLKFKSLLLEDPDLSGFAKQRRRTLLPSEVNMIYQHNGTGSFFGLTQKRTKILLYIIYIIIYIIYN